MLHDFLSDYAKPEMLTASQVLGAFWEDNGNLVHELKRLHTNLVNSMNRTFQPQRNTLRSMKSKIGLRVAMCTPSLG